MEERDAISDPFRWITGHPARCTACNVSVPASSTYRLNRHLTSRNHLISVIGLFNAQQGAAASAVPPAGFNFADLYVLAL